MKTSIIIFSYNREQMLKELIATIPDEFTILVVDDNSDFDIMQFNERCFVYKAPENRGKVGFYKQWAIALEWCRVNDADTFVFMPDDFQRPDWERIMNMANILEEKEEPYLCHLINDGRAQNFTEGKPRPTTIGSEDMWIVNWNDCGFFCNKYLLKELNYKMFKIDPIRWLRNKGLSSGVGAQLTQRLRHLKSYKPFKSFATHGNHVSLMNPEARRQTPLISR
jgi:glycosyltransferase involved in cell wall biosynthesis